MKTKLLMGSLLVTALMAGCSNEEYLEINKDDSTLKRPEINVTFGVDENASTRMIGGGNIAFDGTDKVGAVLVDYDYSKPTDYWNVKEGHIGNNRFAYNESLGKFETDGTMVKGSWLFYVQYDKQMTTSRSGVEFNLPAVQKYATDFSEIAKNDFRISPIVNLAGQEDGHFSTFNLPMVSVYSYANIKMQFPEAVNVQKIVVKPTGTDLKAYDPFASTYTIQNLQVPVAELNNKGPQQTDQEVLDAARANLQNNQIDGTTIPYDKGSLSANFKNVLNKKTGAIDQQLIALDCLDNTLVSTDFSARMAIPAGLYHNISLYAYTDKGVYKYDVKNAYSAKNPADPQDDFYLRRQYSVSLHKINTASQDAGDAFLKMQTTKANIELQSSDETDGTVVISQKDLIAVIKGVSSDDVVKVRVLGDNVKITPEVMAALTAKVAELPNVSLEFSDAVTVEGGESESARMTLHNVEFKGGCIVAQGYVKIGEDVNIPASQTMKIQNANVIFAEDNTSSSIMSKDTYNTIEIGNGAAVKIDNNVTIATITGSNGTLEVATGATLTTTTVNNSGSDITVNGTWNTGALINMFTNTDSGTIINNGEINVTGASSNNSIITNNKNINLSAQLDNSKTITNSADAKLIAGDAAIVGATATLNNVNGAVIINSGTMYCLNGGHTINNTGIIEAKAGSRTYITTNSDVTEVKSSGADVVVRGEVKCENRDADMTVAVKNQQGYISWIVPATISDLSASDGDKFNEIYLSANCDLTSYTAIKYLVINAKATVKLAADLVELTANADATLNVNEKSISILTIAADKEVSIPTGNILGVYEYTEATVIKEYTKIGTGPESPSELCDLTGI